MAFSMYKKSKNFDWRIGLVPQFLHTIEWWLSLYLLQREVSASGPTNIVWAN